MKRLFTALVGLGLFFLCSGPSHAITITETHSDTQSIYDFNGPMKFKGSRYLAVRDKPTYNLDLDLSPDPQVGSVESGSMTMYYSHVVSNVKAEQWSVFVGGEKIGDLVGGHAGKWQSQTFNLSSELINNIVGNPSLALTLVEGTKGADKFLLDKIVFSWQLNEGTPNTILDPVPPPGGGGASPVPEPATLLLLGTGLLGFVGVRKRFRN